MKKALDQTVRELKREVNKKVLKVPGIEQKILDATSNEPWGPHGSHLADIAHATRNYHEYQMIMNVIWKRIHDTGKNWRHVYKGLTVLEYLVAHGSERVIDEIREHAYQISTLSDFQYIDSGGRDQGSNVRRKSQTLVALVNDKEKIQEVRQKALANRDKYRSTYPSGGSYRPGSNSGNGGYGDRFDDDRFEGRYGNRDEDRNGYGRERDWGYKDDDRYGRGGEAYNRDGDRYGRDSDERYGRDSYRDDDYRGGRGNDDQFGSRNRSYDRDRDRSFDDDDRYAPRGGGDRADDTFQDERLPESNLSDQNVSAPPSYETAIKDAPGCLQGEKDGGSMAAAAPKSSSPPAYQAGFPSESTSRGPNPVMAGVFASAQNKEVDGFDEFDPRGSISAAPPTGSTQMDFFGTEASDPVNSLALVPVTYATSNPETDMPPNSGFGTTFVALSSASTSMSQPSEDPFGESPFKATSQDNFPVQEQNFAPKMETGARFDFGDSLGGLTYIPSANGQHSSGDPYMPAVSNGQDSSANPFTHVAKGQHTSANPAFLVPELPAAQVSSDVLGTLLPQTGAAPSVSSHGVQPVAQTNLQTANMKFVQHSGPSAPLVSQVAPVALQSPRPVSPANLQTAPINLLQQPGLPVPLASEATPTTVAGSAAKTHPSKDKFETKSTVWADTLSRGLVNLNISGSKINPLANIGIDFDSINRMEKRKEKEKSSAIAVTSTIAMGKAMGAGSGIGRAGASGIAAPTPNPMIGSSMGVGMGMGGGAGMGMGMSLGGYGGSMNRPMGMGMGMGMNMGMGMGQGAPMRPPTGMPPSGPGMIGYNHMMGMGSYGSQQPYGGGYR